MQGLIGAVDAAQGADGRPLPGAEERWEGAVTALARTLEELLAERDRSQGPELDWPVAVAVLRLVHAQSLPAHLDAGPLCVDALSTPWVGSYALNSLACATLLYTDRGDVASAVECLELGLQHEGPTELRCVLLVNLAQFERRRGRWEAASEALAELVGVAETLDGPERAYSLGLAYGARTANLLQQGALNRARASLAQELCLVLPARCAVFLAATFTCGVRPPPPPPRQALLLARAVQHQVDHLLSTSAFEGAYDLAQRVLAQGVDDPFLLAMRGIALGELGRARADDRDWFLREADRSLARSLAHPGMPPLEGLRAELARVDYAKLGGRPAEVADRLQSCRERSSTIGGSLGELEVGAMLAAAETRDALARGAGADRLRALDERLGAAFEAFLRSWSTARTDGDLAYLRRGERREIVGARMALSIALDASGADAGGADAGGAGGARAAFEDLVRVQGCGSFARGAGIPTPSLDDVREALIEDGHGLLVYLPAPWGGHVFAVDDDGLVHAALAPGHVLSRACLAWRSALERVDVDAGTDELEAALAEVAPLLLPTEVARRLQRWKGVTIVGSVWFFDLPFECLPDPGGEGWLGEARAVDRLPSVPVGVFLASRSRDAAAGGGLTLLVAETPGERARSRWPKLAPLSLTRAQRERLLSPFGDRTRLVDRATVGDLVGLARARSSVVHVLAHGVYESGVEHAGPALVLEPHGDGLGVVRPADVRALEVSGTVLLSACKVGRGPLYWGNDLGGDLGTAWLEAGAQAVVQTDARLRVSHAVAFGERLTHELARGTSPAEAARRVRADLGGPGAGTLARTRWGRWGVLGLGQR